MLWFVSRASRFRRAAARQERQRVQGRRLSRRGVLVEQLGQCHGAENLDQPLVDGGDRPLQGTDAGQ
jgi:hypothetical protein